MNVSQSVEESCVASTESGAEHGSRPQAAMSTGGGTPAVTPSATLGANPSWPRPRQNSDDLRMPEASPATTNHVGAIDSLPTLLTHSILSSMGGLASYTDDEDSEEEDSAWDQVLAKQQATSSGAGSGGGGGVTVRTSRKLAKIPTLSSDGQRQTLQHMASLALPSASLLRASQASTMLWQCARLLRNNSHKKSAGFGRLKVLCQRTERSDSTSMGKSSTSDDDPGQNVVKKANSDEMMRRRTDSDDNTAKAGSMSARSTDCCEYDEETPPPKDDDVWKSSTSEDYYNLSFPTEFIDDFWSHSWRGDVFLKAFTLLLQYNLGGAVAVSSFFSLLAAFLCVQGYLPLVFVTSRGPVGGWCLLFGFVSFALTLALWQSRKRVFLDKVCIHQTDMELKKQGVECIGAFLSHSRRMVVLWDRSYASRVWCVFEVAAFVWANDLDVTDRIVVRPLTYARVWIPMFMSATIGRFISSLLPDIDTFDDLGNGTLWMCTALRVLLTSPVWCPVCLQFLRVFCREVNSMTGLLKTYTLSQAECYCCSVQHKDPDTGAKISCDRAVIQACITAWFGSCEEFQAFVRRDLVRHFQRSLGRCGVPYGWILAALMPTVWSYLDRSVPLVQVGAWPEVAGLLGEGLITWMCVQPLSVAIVVKASCVLPVRDGDGWVSTALLVVILANISIVPVVLTKVGIQVAIMFHPYYGLGGLGVLALGVTVALYRFA